MSIHSTEKCCNPQLTVNRHASTDDFEKTPLTESRLLLQTRKLAEDGYFQFEPVLNADLVERMRQSILTLKKNDWPSVFSFVYDEFWQVARLPALVRLLSAELGPDYRQVPHIWGHYVAPQGGAGWKPHIDSNHQGRRLTIWIALSDATLEGSCMFLIPKRYAPPKLADEYFSLESVSKNDLNTLLKNCRPLPVQAGAILGWEHNIIHWGGMAWDASEPRVSISMEFIQECAKPGVDEQPLLDARQLPFFKQRLLIIAQAIDAYHRFEPMQIKYQELAQRLLSESASLFETSESSPNV